MTIGSLSATEPKLEQIKEALKADDVCQQVMQFFNEGWSDRVDGSLKQYFPVRLELPVHDELLLKDNRLVIPSSMQSGIIYCLHAGHQGITKCRARAKNSLWWPGLGKQLEKTVTNCKICRQFSIQSTEPLIPIPFPQLP